MEILLISFYLIVGLLVINLISKINLNNQMAKECKGRLKLEEYKINMNLNIDTNVISQLEFLIEETFSEYIALNIEYREIGYISAEIEDIICREVSKQVIDKMSPVFFDKISLVYNKSNFSTLIANRVYLHVVNYTLSKNSLQQDKK